MAKVTDLVEVMPQVSASAALRVERGNTGRILDSESTEQREASKLVDEWFASSDDAFAVHPARDQFEEALARVSLCSGEIYAFRGRTPEKMTGRLVFDSREFGPNPLGRLGRYNRDGCPTLYLATSKSGVIAELEYYERVGVQITAQEYFVDFSRLRIADLANRELPAIVAESLDRSERIYSEKSRGDSHLRSNVLADAIRRSGFDGVQVPGVRGAHKNRYCNVVIFDAQPTRWKALLTSRSPSRIHGSCCCFWCCWQQEPPLSGSRGSIFPRLFH